MPRLRTEELLPHDVPRSSPCVLHLPLLEAETQQCVIEKLRSQSLPSAGSTTQAVSKIRMDLVLSQTEISKGYGMDE